jgi:hypothetical protein
MKIFTFFLVALIAVVSITPANAQRRKRATQPEQPQTEQTTPSGNGRRARQEAVRPSVPCTIPIADSPYVRGLQLGLAPKKVDLNFYGDIYFDRYYSAGSSAGGFISSFDFVPLQTPRNYTDTLSPEMKEQIRRSEEKPNSYLQALKEQQKKDREAQAPVIKPFDILKRMNAQFYGRSSPILYNFQIIYRDDLVFENVEAIEQSFAENLKIPVGSWVPIPDPDYSRKVLFSAFSLLDLRLVPVENLILRQADCNGWRAVFVTSPNTTGLALSITNSSVSDNMDQLIAEDQKAINDAKKQRTKQVFKP